MIKVSAFRSVPPFAQGLVRDMRVRWALEEAGIPYEAELIDFGENKTDDYRHLQPFGQVPYYREGDLVLFESGAIVLHIAAKSETLMPDDAAGRAHVTQWVLAALNSVEPQVQNLATIDLFNAETAWGKERRPEAEEQVLAKLDVLDKRLSERDYLEGRFTAADILMVTVLRILRHTDLVSRFPALNAYVARSEARPAFCRALSAQIAPFEEAVAA
ncbi:MAG: glutathione S-transferase family protein [Sphingomonadales bacterium]|nr:MAG: glutathione S-transferase family protein [Sphingomonadales bacterium]